MAAGNYIEAVEIIRRLEVGITRPFDIAETCGDTGKGFAECHHTLPLSTFTAPTKKISGLAIVCTNCHRMLHRARPWKSIDELRLMLRSINSLQGRQS